MRNLVRIAALVLAVTAAIGAPASSASHNDNLTIDKKEPTTHELLSALGLKKLRVPAAHHRKRLAEQGRRHATGDSRMYVIKLPPNTSYYSHAEPAPAAARTLPLQMTSNGKPARVYHWNIPVLQKLAKNRPQARFDDDLLDVESTPTWPKGANDHPNSLDSLAYYVPAKKTSFRKYFSGNGKPKSFYVIEKDKKSAQYHRLLP
ncbi:uncharacterized protein LOC115442794 [Manduca sexta]|uniref:Uncharacterized protein n=1 Tax=Manduca sexta TaxID=7130 RepID=A0A922CJA9_MANSE|nr:uncharacterized protein LOC115442794 [Manduca sexta]KAG6448970.1 hypothetical protein O3G_MSEX005822 [Manduca sexta]